MAGLKQGIKGYLHRLKLDSDAGGLSFRERKRCEGHAAREMTQSGSFRCQRYHVGILQQSLVVYGLHRGSTVSSRMHLSIIFQLTTVPAIGRKTFGAETASKKNTIRVVIISEVSLVPGSKRQ